MSDDIAETSEAPAEPERRDPDQDAAMGAAFVSGTLPDEGRRADDPAEPIAPVYEWIRRGDGTEELYTDGQREHDRAVIAAQRAIRGAV